ncbi:MAG: hypothetical protein J7K68_02780 [Candidatus Diapherotrites archaeon]|nr:hypothetical protein [Candidatus Diapherotrites archaeon]
MPAHQKGMYGYKWKTWEFGIKKEHNKRVREAISTIAKHHGISKEEARNIIILHLKKVVEKTHALEEIEPENVNNADIYGYFLREEWRKLMEKRQ